MFTDAELEYIRSNNLTHLATVNDEGQPDSVPVRYEFDGTHFYIGGQYMTTSRKYRNVDEGNNRVALVMDDMQPGDPPQIRGIRVYGVAAIVEHEGWMGEVAPHLRITPTTHWSWGVEGPAFTQEGFITHKVAWAES